MLPNRVKLSKTATDKLRNIKVQTGVTPNISARIAIMLSLKDGSSLKNINTSDTDGQELNKSVLFGDHEVVYEALIRQYIHDHDIDEPIQRTVSLLVEAGIHKMGHIKSLTDLCNLY